MNSTDKENNPSTLPDPSRLPAANMDVRQKAELQLQKEGSLSIRNMDTLSPEEVKKTLHELQVHRIELEIQNEELQRAQVKLDALRERYFDLYDLAPVGYLSLSEKGMILETNLAVGTLLDVPRSALVNQPLSRFILKDDQEIYYFHRKQLFETDAPQICELRMVKGDGAFAWVQMTATAAMADGVPVCRIVVDDITRLKQAIAQREKLQHQLSQAQKMESVGQLAGGVAHDFNNMLSIIIGHTELIMEEMGETAPMFDSLTEIRKAAGRSADLTRQLLAFAREEAVVPKVVDINHTVEGMLKMLRRIIGEDIELSWIPGRTIYPVKVDPSQMDQMLVNLLSNARDAIGGVGKITIKTDGVAVDASSAAGHPGLTPGDYVRLRVEDDGMGMAPETLKKIFEPFFTTKEMGKGTGLGLATVYGAVKQNNGYIDVKSRPHQGACFDIYLPRHTHTPLTQEENPAAVRHGSCLETILVVEDEPVILKLTRRILKSKGYTVLGATSPAEALKLAQTHKDTIHLLISDVIMPEMNGRDLADKLMALCPGLKCLFMSGYTADIVARQGVLDEGLNFIQKPYTMKGLTEKVHQVIHTAP